MEENFNKHLGNKLKLRRLALGLIRLLIENNKDFKIRDLINYSVTLYEEQSFKFENKLVQKELIDFLDDNKLETSGFHLQAGLQFKVLVLDTFLFYRHTFAEDLIPGEKAFGSINLRIGYGI